MGGQVQDPNTTDVRSLAVAGERLYAGGAFGLMRLNVSDGDRWEQVSSLQSTVLDLAGWHDLLLIATEEGVWSYEPKEDLLTEPGDADWLPTMAVHSLTVSANVPFLASGRAIHWMDEFGTISTFEGPHTGIPGGLSALPGRAGPVWTEVDGLALALSPAENGSYFGSGQAGAVAGEPEGFGDAVVNDVTVAPDGIAYIATDSGLFRMKQYKAQWEHWTTSNGLSANDLRDLEFETGFDRLWIGAYGGVDVLDTSTGILERIGTESGLPSNLVYDIMMQPEDVWIGTDVGGAARRSLAGGEWIIYNTTTGLVADDVQALAIKDNYLLFGTDSGATILNLEDSSLTTHTRSSTSGALKDDWIWCAMEADLNAIWVGTEGGLSHFSTLSKRFVPEFHEWSEGLGVKSLEKDDEGRLWVGTHNGLFILSEGLWEVIAHIDYSMGLPGEEVLALMLDSKGWMWAGTSAGAAMVDTEGHVHATFTTDDGLVHDRITCFEEGQDGSIWIGTAGGLSRLDRVNWELLPLWRLTEQDLPDVYITVDGITPDPDEPNEGDGVNFSVRVQNPSAKRAIATVTIAEDDDGGPGAEIDSAIAYTEPGGHYDVELSWTAVGGERIIWVMLDPTDVVPESNERNNAVAISIHVNRPPQLTDLTYEYMEINNLSDNRSGRFRIEAVYSDPDGDYPENFTTELPSGGGVAGGMTFIPPGDPVSGMLHRGEIEHFYGTIEVLVRVSDGSVDTLNTISIGFNLNIIIVSGAESGSELKGSTTLSVVVLPPWEGSSIEALKVFAVDEDYDYSGFRPFWAELEEVPSEREGLNVTFDAGDVSEGTYDLWVVAFDDRGLAGAAVVEDVTIPEEEATAPGWFWVLVLTLAILAAAGSMTMAARARRKYS
jgi:ligand-binding sensor domain-containing protein